MKPLEKATFAQSGPTLHRAAQPEAHVRLQEIVRANGARIYLSAS
jgi:hypothetical protein